MNPLLSFRQDHHREAASDERVQEEVHGDTGGAKPKLHGLSYASRLVEKGIVRPQVFRVPDTSLVTFVADAGKLFKPGITDFSAMRSFFQPANFRGVAKGFKHAKFEKTITSSKLLG